MLCLALCQVPWPRCPPTRSWPLLASDASSPRPSQCSLVPHVTLRLGLHGGNQNAWVSGLLCSFPVLPNASITDSSRAEGPHLLSSPGPPRDSGHRSCCNYFFILPPSRVVCMLMVWSPVSTGLEWYFFSVSTSVRLTETFRGRSRCIYFSSIILLIN